MANEDQPGRDAAAVAAATRDVLRRYEHDLYNARDLTQIPVLLADPMYRHDAGGKVTVMTNADCVNRIGGFFAQYSQLVVRTVHLLVEGSFASWTYELTGRGFDGSTLQISSIEIFEVQDGKIIRCGTRNTPKARGRNHIGRNHIGRNHIGRNHIARRNVMAERAQSVECVRC